MLKNGYFHIIACVLVIFMTACMAAAGGRLREVPITATVLAAGWQCQPAPAGWRATWISSAEELQTMVAKCRSNRIGGDSSASPAVDFGRFGVLAVEMGQKSSAGYGFDTEHISAQRTGETATVTLPHIQPAPGAMTAQVITAPWILIQLPAEGFREIRVVDQEGAILAQTDRP